MADAKAEISTPNHAAKPPEKKPRSKHAIVLGALVCIAVLACGALLMRGVLHRDAAPAARPADGTTGVVRLQELVQAHPEYERLQTLMAERTELKARLKQSLDVPLAVQPVAVDSKPFDDSVWQKNAQDVIGRRFELERAQKKAAADYKAATEADYKAQSNAINEEYLNAILNIKIKLDNREAMRLTDDVIAKLNADLDELEAERAGRQIALYRQWKQDIEAYAAQSVAKEFAASRADMETLKNQREAEAAKAQSEAQQRDITAITARMNESAAKQQQAVATQTMLHENEQQILALESKILNDIASKAAKVAILHHFTLIVCDPARSLTSLLPDGLRPAAGPDVPERYVKTVSVNATDVTDEVKDELAADPPTPADDAATKNS